MRRQQRIILLIAFILALNTAVFAQLPPSSSQPGAGTRRAFTLFGDLKVDDSQAGAPANAMFDVILYTRGNELFSRQRVENGGRYRFNSVFNGDYYLVVELDNLEVARMPLVIPANAGEHIRQDLEFSWKAGARNAAGVVSAAESYNRTQQNRELFDKAMKQIKNNNLAKASDM